MSGRSVPPNHRPARRRLAAALLAGCALAVVLIPAPALGQPPRAGEPGADAPDDKPPLPPEESQRASTAARYRIDPDRLIFTGRRDPKTGAQVGGVQDDLPVATEAGNPDEYNAWTEVTLHARQFTAAELEQAAARDLTPEDLTRTRGEGGRAALRLELVRFDGRLTKLRRVDPTRALAGAGVKDVYEGWVVPADESPANPVCVVFTDPPSGIDPGPQPENRWVTFAGYFFKVMAYPGPDADPAKVNTKGWLSAPVLVGRGITAQPGPPPEAARIPLNKGLRVFKRIKDDAKMATLDTRWEEVAAWDRVVLHARKFPQEELEKAARRDLGFADLFNDVRRDYKLDLVYLEGELVRLRKGEPSPRLAEAGVPAWYEGWLIPKGAAADNPVCLVVSELPEGLEPQPPGKAMHRWVSFAGYSFKKMRYESGETLKEDPTRHQWKAAPLLIGHSLTPLGEDGSGGPAVWAKQFVPLLLAGLLAIVGVALGLGWWFRKGDRRARAEADAVRYRNPFGEPRPGA